MTTVTLYRTDPTRNMARYYHLEIQPDLFGTWSVIREWGRIGRHGQTRQDSYANEAQAADALIRRQIAKERRGYKV